MQMDNCEEAFPWREEDFDSVDDFVFDASVFATDSFQDPAFDSPRCLSGDDSLAGCESVLPVPWLSWSDALVGGNLKQNDANSDLILQSFLSDPDQPRDAIALNCNPQNEEDEETTDCLETRCLTPTFLDALEAEGSSCGAKRGTDCIAAEDTDAESHCSQEEPTRKRMRRGEHVKGRTEMQETAREGQKHWATKVVDLRDEWEKKNVGRLNKQYVWQLRMCERLRVKPQRECILLALQIATVDGLIMPFPFIDSKSSLGWSGFQVKKDHSEEFRRRIQSMFTSDCKSTTINNTFRRAGLVAEGNWERAWRGVSPFVYPHWQTS